LVRDLRVAAGERPVGRKIGFTNPASWSKFRAEAPMWGYMFASTVNDQGKASHASLAGVVEPRIEPEIIFGLAAAPTRDMDEQALTGCMAWIAHGFEVVCSIFPGWDCLAADAVAGFGMHSSLWIGPRSDYVTRADEWALVTTGSLTRAPPIAAGEVWTTRMTGIPLEGSRLALTAG